MKLHELTVTPGARRPRMRVGRGMGSGKGKTCGRGHKGQYARSGHKHKPGFEGGQMRLIRRLPKRGFKHARATRYAPVNLSALAERFGDGAVVDLAALRTAGLVRTASGGVKILGTGDIAKKLIVKAQAFSAGARAKIEAAGGTCEVVGRNPGQPAPAPAG
jgi:large subunit ribosomal protein L15